MSTKVNKKLQIYNKNYICVFIKNNNGKHTKQNKLKYLWKQNILNLK